MEKTQIPQDTLCGDTQSRWSTPGRCLGVFSLARDGLALFYLPRKEDIMEKIDRFLIQAARITIKVQVISIAIIAMILAIGFLGPVGIILSVLGAITLLGHYRKRGV